ncbi:MAG: hypothetical protein LIO74_02060 [Ruminococcus sp.]|nr:hypothetical protein [Ruminococcus sp.]
MQTTDTDAKQTESTTTTTQTSLTLRQSIFLYYELNWNGVWYDTQYITISSLDISNYLGPAVTEGTDVDDTYTVLVYEIECVDTSESLVVQYAEKDEYYIFQAMS